MNRLQRAPSPARRTSAAGRPAARSCRFRRELSSSYEQDRLDPPSAGHNDGDVQAPDSSEAISTAALTAAPAIRRTWHARHTEGRLDWRSALAQLLLGPAGERDRCSVSCQELRAAEADAAPAANDHRVLAFQDTGHVWSNHLKYEIG